MSGSGQVAVILPVVRLSALVLADAGADRRAVVVAGPPLGRGEFG